MLVWQKSHEIVLEVYRLTGNFPPTERYALVDQIRRAAYSIPSNIVEGHSKNSRKEFLRFLYIARGSVDVDGEIKFDASKPDGTPRKLLDVSGLHELGWRHSVDLREGIERLYRWYVKQDGRRLFVRP